MPFLRCTSNAAAAAVALLVLLTSGGCDVQRISELQPGQSSEADVRERFGVPENVWNESDGGRTLEYNRQPAGQVNYMITLGPDGKLAAVHQVLTPANFARVQPGMPMDKVRRLLGKPAKTMHYSLKNETEVDWRFAEGSTSSKVFTVVHGPDRLVLRTRTGDDLDAPGFKGGGK